MEQQTLPDFSGKIVFVSLVRGGEACFALSKVHFETIGDRLFLKWEFASGLTPGFDGKSVAIAWQWVESYLIFDSTQDYTQSCNKYGYKQWRAKWRRRVHWFYGND